MQHKTSAFAVGVVATMVLLSGLQPRICAAQEASIQSQQRVVVPRPEGRFSGQGEPPARSTLSIPGGQPNPALELPQVWHPTAAQPLPPPPPVIAEPVMPANFIGCWEGSAGAWDEFTRLPTANPMGYNIGVPGKIRFCYRNNAIEVPEAEVYISPAKRVLDLALNLGLNYNTATAHGINTDIFSISPTMIHARTNLTVVIRAHLLLIVPVDALSEPVIDDETVTLETQNVTKVSARQVLMIDGKPQYSATWHAYFNRVAAKPAE